MKVHKAQMRHGIPLIKLILYGMGNSGKTTLAYSFHNDLRTGPVLGLNIGGNPDLVAMWSNGPTILDLEKYQDMDQPYDFLYSGQKPNHPFRKVLASAGVDPSTVYRTLVVDTFSDWQRDFIEKTAGDDAPGILSQSTPPEATKHGAKILTGTTKAARNMLLNLPMNVVLVLQEAEVIDFATGNKTLQPSLYGQSRRMIGTWATMMGQMDRIADKEQGGRSVPIVYWDRPSQDAWVKNQIAPGRLGKGMKNPTATKIVDQIQDYYKKLAIEEVITQDVLTADSSTPDAG